MNNECCATCKNCNQEKVLIHDLGECGTSSTCKLNINYIDDPYSDVCAAYEPKVK